MHKLALCGLAAAFSNTACADHTIRELTTMIATSDGSVLVFGDEGPHYSQNLDHASQTGPTIFTLFKVGADAKLLWRTEEWDAKVKLSEPTPGHYASTHTDQAGATNTGCYGADGGYEGSACVGVVDSSSFDFFSSSAQLPDGSRLEQQGEQLIRTAADGHEQWRASVTTEANSLGALFPDQSITLADSSYTLEFLHIAANGQVTWRKPLQQ